MENGLELLDEHADYIGAIYFILTQLQISEFEQEDDPLEAATAMADRVRHNLRRAGARESISKIVIEFFDQVATAIRLRTPEDPH